MDFIVNNWFLIMALVAVLGISIFAVIKFFNLPTQAQITKIKEWLVYACMEAEKQLGSNTGKLKLRMVYDMFLTKFTWLAKIITFEQFSSIVDESLTEFKAMLDSNNAVEKLVKGE